MGGTVDVVDVNSNIVQSMLISDSHYKAQISTTKAIVVVLLMLSERIVLLTKGMYFYWYKRQIRFTMTMKRGTEEFLAKNMIFKLLKIH